jgi:hypothetical protein
VTLFFHLRADRHEADDDRDDKDEEEEQKLISNRFSSSALIDLFANLGSSSDSFSLSVLITR